ncbi:MAG TPA: tetratricopeptide repeat protein, partial [Blastocatellia bacterium]
IEQSIPPDARGYRLEIVPKLAVRDKDLQTALLEHKPDIVHFCGHGEQTGDLMLEDETGNRKVVNREAISDLFRILKRNIRLVVLNACYSKEQARALTETIDFAIGTSDAIEENAARTFAARLYESLALGYSLKEAFDLAVNQLAIQGIDPAQAPELMSRNGADASEFRIVELSPTDSESSPRETEQKARPTVFLLWLFVSITTSLIADVARRFLSGGLRWLDSLALVAQSALAAVAVIAAMLFTASLMRPASPLVKKAARLGGQVKRPERAALLSAIALIIASALWLSLPRLARYYNERGIGFQYGERSDLAHARESYHRAVRLNPAYAQAHYNLATVYEDLHPEKAMDEYLLAIACDSNIYPAYNNLARLYLLRGKEDDCQRALDLLSRAVDLSPQLENAQYSINKNLGWANYALKRYSVAEIYLRRAISMKDEDGAASAHCLLAKVLKEQGKEGVYDECFKCVTLAPGEKDVEPAWVSDAQECLMKGDGK